MKRGSQGRILLLLVIALAIGAFFVFVNMIFAVGLAHRAELFILGKQGGYALELQAMFLFTALALVFMNPGKYSITRRFLRWGA